MVRPRYLFSFLLLITFLQSSHALDIDVGANFLQPRLFTSKNDNEGQLQNEYSALPYLAVTTQPRQLGKSNWGYFLEFWGGYFDIDRQLVAGEKVNLNTGVYGTYAYLTPTLYYRIGNPENWNLYLGLGLGIGYLDINGSIALTNHSPQQVISVNEDAFGRSLGYLIQINKKDWFGRFISFGPVVKIDNAEFFLNTTSFVFGRKFSFNRKSN